MTENNKKTDGFIFAITEIDIFKIFIYANLIGAGLLNGAFVLICIYKMLDALIG